MYIHTINVKTVHSIYVCYDKPRHDHKASYIANVHVLLLQNNSIRR